MDSSIYQIVEKSSEKPEKVKSHWSWLNWGRKNRIKKPTSWQGKTQIKAGSYNKRARKDYEDMLKQAGNVD